MWTLAEAADLTRHAIVGDLLVIMGVIAFTALVMQRMRLALVPAYLVAGAVIGPQALGFVASEQTLADVSQFAIILLLFGIGLELDVTVLRRGLARMLVAGLVSCFATVVIGWPVAMAFGVSPPAALALAMAFSLSSTAVVLRIIADRRELRRRSGRLAFAILVVQDITVLAMLAGLPMLATWSHVGAESETGIAPGSPDLVPEGYEGVAGFAIEAVTRLGGVSLLVIVAKVLLPPILRESLKARRLEVMLLVGIAAALGAAVAARAIGFSLEMGAFLAGFVLAGTPFRHQLSGQIGPLRDILSALFFTTVGMKLDPQIVIESWWVIGLALVVLTVGKAVVIGGASWCLGAMASTSLAVGLSLAQAGEFTLIIIGRSTTIGLLDGTVAAVCIAVVVMSLFWTPGLARLGRWLAGLIPVAGHAPWVRSSLVGGRPEDEEPSGDHPAHIIIGGFGPIGRRLADALDEMKVSYAIVELNPDTVLEQLRRKRSIVFGDVGNAAVLESAGIGRADALVLTVPDEDAVLRACAVARRRAPDLFIAARIGLVAKGPAAERMGANVVITDEIATADAILSVVAKRFAPPASGEVVEVVAEPEPEPTAQEQQQAPAADDAGSPAPR